MGHTTRYQQGYVFESGGSFHVRFYQTELIDGQPRRVQRCQRLCIKDAEHRSKTCKAVRQLVADKMAEVNGMTAPVTSQSVSDFWTRVYLPFITDNLRHSTVHGYKQIWEQHLKAHFGTSLLRDYKTPTGSMFLTRLAKTLGRHTLQHIRSLASGIFSHAVNVGAVETNPWHDCKILGRTIEPGQTQHYSLEEIENVINALISRPDAQELQSMVELYVSNSRPELLSDFRLVRG